MQVNTSLSRTVMGTFEFLCLVYHSIVWNVRKGKRSALMALANEVFQSVIMVVFFWVMISFLGMRSLAIRGSFVLYVMSGVFLYLTHNKAMGSVGGGAAGGPMLNHAPVTTLMMMVAGALSTLYIQIFAVLVVTFAANVIVDPFVVHDLKILSLAFIMAWFSGVAIGIVFMSLTPFFPEIMKILNTVYKRGNMIFSGKMIPGNTLPSFMLPFFLWNPLFHTIDQARGAAFVNYDPRYTSMEYVLWVSLGCIIIGMMLEHWTRKYFSVSWNATR